MVKLIECAVTWQGEGPDSGQRMLLTRFKYCNKTCDYCDTQVKMRTSVESDFSLSVLQKTLDDEKLGIMITGGEPTVKKHFDDTVNMLNNLKYVTANIETNGHELGKLLREVNKTKPVKYMFSPKIFNQRDLTECIEIFKQTLTFDSVYYKIVYQPDNIFIHNFLDYIVEKGVNNRVYLMPEGATKDELMKNSGKVFDAAEKYRVNFSSRTHLIYSFI